MWVLGALRGFGGKLVGVGGCGAVGAMCMGWWVGVWTCEGEVGRFLCVVFGDECGGDACRGLSVYEMLRKSAVCDVREVVCVFGVFWVLGRGRVRER